MLQDELKALGLTKTKLSEIMGVSRQTIQRMGDEISPEVRTVLNSLQEPDYKWLDISIKLFDGAGRGNPIKIENREGKYVLISRGWVTIEGGQDLNQGVISEEDWKARLDYTCKHGRPGWSCKVCLR